MATTSVAGYASGNVGASAPIEALLTSPRADESWNDERHRLGQYAWRLWEPLLTGAEQVGPL